MVNKFPALCEVCDCTVPTNGGKLEHRRGRWEVRHLSCADGQPRVVQLGDATQNINGRCEDAPCCGCCS